MTNVHVKKEQLRILLMACNFVILTVSSVSEPLRLNVTNASLALSGMEKTVMPVQLIAKNVIQVVYVPHVLWEAPCTQMEHAPQFVMALKELFMEKHTA